MEKKFALVTGASQGLGKSIVLELAKRGYHLLLVSLPNENLAKLAEEVKKHQVEAYFLEIDMTKKDNLISLGDWANAYPISVLVNNAGCGGSKKIEEASLNYIETIIDLNIRATAIVTKLILPNLNKQKRGYILNISSMAAFSPIGFKTVYPASKKFIEYFSLGLHEELKEQNTSVSVAYPGPMKTNSEVTNRIEQQNKFVNAGVVNLDTIAQISVNGMFKNKQKIIPGKLNVFSRYLLAILPDKTKIAMLSNAIKKELNS